MAEILEPQVGPQVETYERKRARGFLRNVVLLIPNFLKLLYRLFKDSRVPKAEKAMLLGAIVYVISPLDLLPDVMPFVGQVDDLYLASLTLLRLLNRAPDEAIYEHWDGGGDLPRILNGVVRAAKFVLPRRVARILLGRVEVGPKFARKLLASPAHAEYDEVEAPEKKKLRGA
jgi:uncharacterized membrane protein YkvA (DUF1232 family)